MQSWMARRATHIFRAEKSVVVVGIPIRSIVARQRLIVGCLSTTSTASTAFTSKRKAPPNKYRISQIQRQTSKPASLIAAEIWNFSQEKNIDGILSNLPDWTKRIETVETPVTAKEISHCLYGIRGVDKTKPANVKVLLPFLNAISKKIANSSEFFLPINIGQCCLGLTGFNHPYAEVEELLNQLVNQLRACSTALDIRVVSNCIYGLQGLTFARNNAFVEQMLFSIHSQLCSIRDADPDSISYILLGLKNADISNKCVQMLLSQTSMLLRNSGAKLEGKYVALYLSSCANMSSSFHCVQQFVDVIADKLSTATTRMTAIDFGYAAHGLKLMCNDSVPVDRLLVELAKKLAAVDRFEGPQFFSLIYGLCKMNAQSRGIDAFVAAIADVYQRSAPVALDSVMIGKAARGLAGLNAASSSRTLLMQILTEIISSKASLSISSAHSALTVASTLHSLHSLTASSIEEKQYIKAVTNHILRKCRSGTPFPGSLMGFGLVGLQHLNSTIPEVRALLVEVERILRTDAIADTQPSNVSYSFFGLQSIHNDFIVADQLLHTLHRRLERIEVGTMSLNSIALAAYGLHSMEMLTNKQANAMRAIFVTLSAQLAACREKLTLPDLARLLFSTKGKNCSYFEVRNWIYLVTQKVMEMREYEPQQKSIASSADRDTSSIHESSSPFDGPLPPLPFDPYLSHLHNSDSSDKAGNSKHFVFMFHSFIDMNSEVFEVRNLLKYLMPILEQAKQETFSAELLASMLNTMSSLVPDCPEVVDLIRLYVELIDRSSEKWDEHVLASSLYGIQNMSLNHAVVGELIASLVGKLNELDRERQVAILSPAKICSALYGLHSLQQTSDNSTRSNSNVLINRLLGSIDRCFAHQLSGFDLRSIGMAIYGLQHKDATQPTFGSIAAKLAACVDSLPIPLGSNDMHNFIVSDYLLSQLHQTAEVSLLRNRLRAKQAASEAISPMDENAITYDLWKTEHRVAEIARRAFASDVRTVVESSKYLHCFEADIVIRQRCKSGDNVINVEVDGIYHSFARKKKYCSIRDKILSDSNVRVVRLRVEEIEDMTDIELMKKLHGLVEHTGATE